MPLFSSRRRFLSQASMAGASLVMPSIFKNEFAGPVLDHLLLGAASLEEGTAFVESKTGVKAVYGGKHPNIGTHNALIDLGYKQYLEVIAPNPEAELIPMYAFMKQLKTPTLFTWAARTEEIEQLLQEANKAGYGSMGINPGSRLRPDGKLLKWRSLNIDAGIPALVPFFIQWDKESIHPSVDSPKGCTLKSFKIFAPDSAKLDSIFASLGIKIPVVKGETGRLEVILNTPKGEVII